MTKRISAKYKIDRRLGCNLWGRPKSPFNKRNSKPGQHGALGQRKKLSDYGNQLFAKQKLKFYYGDLTEKQFRKIYQKASNIKGDTSQILIELLERRLDAIVYRMKFVPTIFAARQLVNHGHVKVNGKRVNIPSYSVKDGDEILKSLERDLKGVDSRDGFRKVMAKYKGEIPKCPADVQTKASRLAKQRQKEIV